MKKTTIIITVLLVILIGALIIIAQPDRTTPQVTTDNNQETERQEPADQTADVSDKAVPQEKGSGYQVVDSQSYFYISEWDIRFPVDPVYKDELRYYFEKKNNSGYEMISFSYLSEEKVNVHCKAEELPNGVYEKIPGKYADYEKNAEKNGQKPASREAVIKEFDDYFIYYTAPQAPCMSAEEHKTYIDGPGKKFENIKSWSLKEAEKFTVMFSVPELGIQFPVSSETKEILTYYYEKGEGQKIGSVWFSTKEAESKGAGCLAKDGPVGAITRVRGKAEGDVTDVCPGNRFVKQLPNSFICFYTPQAENGCFGKPVNGVLHRDIDTRFYETTEL